MPSAKISLIIFFLRSEVFGYCSYRRRTKGSSQGTSSPQIGVQRPGSEQGCKKEGVGGSERYTTILRVRYVTVWLVEAQHLPNTPQMIKDTNDQVPRRAVYHVSVALSCVTPCHIYMNILKKLFIIT